MQLRTTYPGFVDSVNHYFDKLVSIIKPLMVSPNNCFHYILFYYYYYPFFINGAAKYFFLDFVFLSLKMEDQSSQCKLRTSMDHMQKMKNTCHL